MNNEQQKQWEQDIADYGDNAYLMWFCDQLNSGNPDFESNIEFIEHFEMGYSIRRKESAALPFDLERAIAGDAVVFLNESDGKYYDCEIKMTGKGLVCYPKFPPDQSVYVGSIYQKQMFMKFPPKVSSGSRGSNHE